jgi:hypothetical protein
MWRRKTVRGLIAGLAACIYMSSLVSAPPAYALPNCNDAPYNVQTGLTSDGRAHFFWIAVPGVDNYVAYLSGTTMGGVLQKEVRNLGKENGLDVPFVLNGMSVRTLSLRLVISCQNNQGSAPEERGMHNPVTISNPAAVTAPDRPVDVHVSRVGRDVLVTWSAPISASGSLPSDYLVTVRPGGSTCTSKGGLQCSLKNLKAGGNYTFAVQAKNATGLGPAVSVQFRVPAAPKPTQGLS